MAETPRVFESITGHGMVEGDIRRPRETFIASLARMVLNPLTQDAWLTRWGLVIADLGPAAPIGVVLGYLNEIVVSGDEALEMVRRGMFLREIKDLFAESRVGPLDPNGVMPVDVDVTALPAITGYDFESPTAGIEVGDGVKTKDVPAESGGGDGPTTLTPVAPALAAGVFTFNVFLADASILERGKDYTVIVHLYSGQSFADDATIVFQLADR